MTADDVAVAPLDRQAAAMNESPIYELFIGLMTIISLIIVFFHVIVRVPQVDAILTSTDTLVCFLFLFDFARSYRRAPDKRVVHVRRAAGRTLPRGLFDLLGSIPSVSIFRVLRIFRVAAADAAGASEWFTRSGGRVLQASRRIGRVRDHPDVVRGPARGQHPDRVRRAAGTKARTSRPGATRSGGRSSPSPQSGTETDSR